MSVTFIRNDFVRKINCHECHIFMSIEMVLSSGDDCFRGFLNDVVHDRKIMGSQVPHYIYIMLEKPEVDPRRVEIIELPQGAVIDEFPNFPHGAAKQKRVIHHDLEPLAIR